MNLKHGSMLPLSKEELELAAKHARMVARCNAAVDFILEFFITVALVALVACGVWLGPLLKAAIKAWSNS